MDRAAAQTPLRQDYLESALFDFVGAKKMRHKGYAPAGQGKTSNHGDVVAKDASRYVDGCLTFSTDQLPLGTFATAGKDDAFVAIQFSRRFWLAIFLYIFGTRIELHFDRTNFSSDQA